jgi:3-oxoadipate enol-lactonase
VMKNTSDPALSTVQTTLGSIAFSDRGAGVPIILWPSLFTTHRIFDAMIVPLVEAGWRTIAVDGPGFGASDPPHGLVQPETYADLIIEIADRLELPEIAFAGCSWGGLIGAHLGVLHADRVRSLVLMGTPFFPSRGGHLVEFLGAKFAVKLQAFANGVAHSMLSPSTLDRPDLVERLTSPFASFKGKGAALTVNVTLRHSAGLEGVMPALHVPTTILLGQEDKLYPPEDMRPVATLTPNAQIVVVPNAGHIIPLEAPDAAVAAIGRG